VINRCIRRDNSGDAVLLRSGDYLFEVRERKIGRDFQQHRLSRGLVFIANGAEQLTERVMFLQGAEPGSVR
jgi:hypothetical protein